MITVRPVRDAADLEQAYAIRAAVFFHEQGVPLELERDACDVTADHVLAIDGGRPVGTGRLVVEHAGGLDEVVAHLGRIAVLADARGGGVGAAVVAGLEDLARDRGLRTAVLGAQVTALRFYQRLGYEAYGPVFDDAGLPHRWMRRTLRPDRPPA